MTEAAMPDPVSTTAATAGTVATRLPHFQFPGDAAGWGVVVVSAVAGLVAGGLTINAVSSLLRRVLER